MAKQEVNSWLNQGGINITWYKIICIIIETSYQQTEVHIASRSYLVGSDFQN